MAKNSITSRKAFGKPHLKQRAKALWVTAFPKQVKKPREKSKPKKINRSDSERQREYLSLRKDFLKRFPGCACSLKIDCNVAASEIHHKNGRIGSLLCDTSHWMGVCRKAHTWIDSHREEARTFGWLAPVGSYNSTTRNS